MNICIFGAAGFIGTNLIIRLAQNEANHIMAIDSRLDYFGHLKRRHYKNLDYLEQSFTKSTNFEKILDGQEVVFHLVSTTVPATSNIQIAGELEANVISTAVFLEACVKCGIKKVIFISSGGTVYGVNQRCPLKEELPLNPISSYGIQKIAIEKLFYLYRYLFGLDYRVIRLANPYGPYQRPNGVLGAVTTFTYKALKDEEIKIYGDGSVVRDFVYIDDAIDAILKIAFHDDGFQTFNVGCGKGTNIRELLQIIQDVLGKKPRVVFCPGRKADVPVNYLDISRYESLYGKLARINLPEGIQKTAGFLRTEYAI